MLYFRCFFFEYHEDKYVMGIDPEKVLVAGCTGLHTRAGDLLTVTFKYANLAAGGAIDDGRLGSFE